MSLKKASYPEFLLVQTALGPYFKIHQVISLASFDLFHEKGLLGSRCFQAWTVVQPES